ncbi:lycopene cyclase family protein [Spongiimicrobium salis]|uniref:lycopene cyclase family protein n=1 Tax=Spongiimicrobium salis TaxID=1667022 RepID=UPI00374D396D
MITYDYIIIGAGAAGLLLADALGKDSFFKETSILLLDKDRKRTNDRTWCFWEKGEGDFDEILYRQWDNIHFAGEKSNMNLSIAPYGYKMIRGIDFYDEYSKRVRSHPNVSYLQETVLNTKEVLGGVEVQTSNTLFVAKRVFNSIFDYKQLLKQQQYPVLQQHFIGWRLKTGQEIFDDTTATFMDFSIPQDGNTRFMYVLPFSKTEAIVEYTLFSEALLSTAEYEDAIKAYLHDKFQCSDYEILEKEQGSIPMTCYDFSTHNTEHTFHIGTAGGWSKPSTGYTFMNTSKKVKAMVQQLKDGKPLKSLVKRNRFWYYDLLLLDILHRDNIQGGAIFEALFKNRTPQQIFQFLDEETPLSKDLWVILGAPKIPFIKALYRRLISANFERK